MANDFSIDDNCVALYNFDSLGEVGTDSLDGLNNLTPVSIDTMDTVTQKQGTAAVVVDGAADYLTLADASMTSDFPFKNGTSNTELSLCTWVKFATAVLNDTITAKFDGVGNRSFRFSLSLDGADLRFDLRVDDGGTQIVFDNTVAVQTGVWYHVGWTYKSADKSYRIRIYDANADATTETAGTHTGTAVVTAGNFAVGGRATGGALMDGTIDEMVVFNDILSSDEIDRIRLGIYRESDVALTPYNTNKRAVMVCNNVVWYEDI